MDMEATARSRTQNEHCAGRMSAGSFSRLFRAAEKTSKKTEAYRALERIGQIFHVETELQKLEPAKRAKERDRLERPLAESLFAWAEEIIERGTISSINVKGAFKYMLARKEELSSYLDNGSLPMTNSLAERTIRNFAVGRNNWLFSEVLEEPRLAECSTRS
ncbi:IS66 family transposase [Dubosiella newyorkensis]|uniref:IS66 family transposase n=1 Tax=Dubosiella newyorkensis TaxID=1862672 RepID=UPI003F6684BA